MKHVPRRKQPVSFVPRMDCEKKRIFLSEAEALNAAEHQMLQHMELTIAVYQCSICGHWHLTRQTETQE